MSTVFTDVPTRGPEEQSPGAALPIELDPSGFTERAPTLAALLPDERLARALARGDAFAVHAALSARLSTESSGALRDTLRKLLARPDLFAMAERPPRLWSLLGTGVAFGRLPPPEQQQAPFIATRAVRLFGMPVWPLSQHLLQHGRDGRLEVVARVPSASSHRLARWTSASLTAAALLTGIGVGLVPFVAREVYLVNGFSRPVEVHVDEHRFLLEPGAVVTQRMYRLGGTYEVTARWPGEEWAFEQLQMEAAQRAVYNVLGAAAAPVEDASEQAPMRWVEGSTGSLSSSEQLMVRRGSWEEAVRQLLRFSRGYEATLLAQRVALADITAGQAREEAARGMLRHTPLQVEDFARKLQQLFPDDVATHQLAHELLVARGQADASRAYYHQQALEAPQSVHKALLHAWASHPSQQRDAYAAVLARFPQAPEAQRALARIRFADGYPRRALELLQLAAAKAPESFEDVELRVRALVALKRVRDASGVVRAYAEEPRHRTWELAVLAGRLARLAGPVRTQYVTRDLVPPALLATPEQQVLFKLLTGDGTVKDEELEGIRDPVAFASLQLTRTVLTDLEEAVDEVASFEDAALERMPLEAAAVLALELARRGDSQNAERVFSTHLALRLAQEPLEAYVRRGELSPRFPFVSPDLLAAAYLVRTRDRGSKDIATEQAYARATEGLEGFARRALDPDHEEAIPRPVHPVQHTDHVHSRREILQIIKGYDASAFPAEQLGDRLERPWQWP